MVSSIFRWLGGFLLFIVASSTTWAQLSTPDIADTNLPSVVHIEVFNKMGEKSSTGSGFIVSANGLIVTNYHVIEGADTAKVKLQSEESFRVDGIIALDAERDFTLIKIPAVDLPIVRMGNSDNIKAGQTVIAIGSPIGLSGSVSEGIISQIRSRGEYKMIQHDAAISPGSSGGPLFNQAGEVIGINTLQYNEGQNLNFALPINYVRGVLDGDLRVKVTLSELSNQLEKKASDEQEEALKQIIINNFIQYQDPEGLFTAIIPSDWSIQRNQSYDEKNGITLIDVIVSSRNAELASNDWISEGILFHYEIRKNGVWSDKEMLEILNSSFKSALESYDQHQSSDITQVNFGNLQMLNVNGVGELHKLSKPEVFTLYGYISPQFFLYVSLSMPKDKQEYFMIVDTLLQNSFKTTLVGQ